MTATLASILRPYRPSRIADALGVNISTVHRWAHGKSTPGAEQLPKLAEILRMDLGELTTIVSQDSKRRESAQVAGV